MERLPIMSSGGDENVFAAVIVTGAESAACADEICILPATGIVSEAESSQLENSIERFGSLVGTVMSNM